MAKVMFMRRKKQVAEGRAELRKQQNLYHRSVGKELY